MAVKKGQEITLDIDTLAIGGKGMGRVDGMAVFVDQVVPGDRVRVRITRKKKNYAEARVMEMMAPSKERIAPPCPYSGFCGGCKWQFLPYERQLAYKTDHVAQSIAHIGLLENVPVHPAIASPNVFAYRNKMEFSCSDHAWLLPHDMDNPDAVRDFAVGLHVPGTFHKVLDTDACMLQPSAGNRILSDVRQYMRHSGLAAYGLKSHKGFWRFVMLRHAPSRDHWMVNIITASENPTALDSLAQQLMATHPRIVSVVNNITASKAGIAVGEREVLLGGVPVLTDGIGDFSFEISANSFFQTNTGAAERLYETVARYAGLTGRERVLDLYCGTGTIGIYLSRQAAWVTGMELVESAVNDARNNCRLNGIDNCRFVGGDIKEQLACVSERPDVLIIDPPRVGMHKDVVKQVLAMGPDRIVYVSCNPATLARDLQMMDELYRVCEVQPVDMFPHTFHIEAVARLEKK